MLLATFSHLDTRSLANNIQRVQFCLTKILQKWRVVQSPWENIIMFWVHFFLSRYEMLFLVWSELKSSLSIRNEVVQRVDHYTYRRNLITFDNLVAQEILALMQKLVWCSPTYTTCYESMILVRPPKSTETE